MINILLTWFKSYDLWHGKLGHVNYKYIQRLINLELLSSIMF
jgi:hypothetical protein